jgi:5-methylcytosine-specific restriction endonuclease McrA
MTDWFRVFFADGRGIAVEGDAELARILARKTPRAIYREPAVIYRCQHCGTEGPWTPSWRTWVVLNHHPEHIRAKAGGGEYIACSIECFGDLVERSFAPPHWARCSDEPRQGERAHALYAAIGEERRRRASASDYRKVPMPKWRGRGFCKWCNQPMSEADKPRTMWHAECARQWTLHAFLAAQTKHLRARDGRLCAMPGCNRPGGEVDHRKPLWKVRDLPDMIRRAFYGPMNLWLLCGPCHAAKTKREAGERAALRAGERDRPDTGPIGGDISDKAGVAVITITSKT